MAPLLAQWANGTLGRIEMTFVTTRGHKDKALISRFRVIQSAVNLLDNPVSFFTLWIKCTIIKKNKIK